MKNRVERINPRCDQCGGDSSPQHSTLRSKLERRAAAAETEQPTTSRETRRSTWSNVFIYRERNWTTGHFAVVECRVVA